MSDEQGRPEIFIILTCTESICTAVLCLSFSIHFRVPCDWGCLLCQFFPMSFVNFGLMNKAKLRCHINRKHMLISLSMSMHMIVSLLKYSVQLYADCCERILMSYSAFGNAMLFFLALLLFTMFLSLFRSHFFWYLMILNHSNLDCMSGSMI
jgi:hypothetical protein